MLKFRTLFLINRISLVYIIHYLKMLQIKKIFSGGQTGVDRGALEAALQCGIAIGGWCPPNRKAEDGRIPDFFPLKETPTVCSLKAPDVPRSLRTEWNVRDADATLILTPKPEQEIDPGTQWTKICCQFMNKPFLISNPYEGHAIHEIVYWLQRIKPNVLNIAGPSETRFSGIQHVTKSLVEKVLNYKLNNELNSAQ